MTENNNKKHILFITGAAGYVGGMLCDQFAKRNDVEKIVGLDVEERPEFLKDNRKLVWVRANTANREWENKIAGYEPTILIHAAWHIREMYGKRKEQWQWNVEGSERVFNFAFQTPSIQKVIYFSTASLYGAYKTNTIEHRFTEDELMREEEYSYGREKKKVEEILRDIHKRARDNKNIHRKSQLFVLRLSRAREDVLCVFDLVCNQHFQASSKGISFIESFRLWFHTYRQRRGG